MQDVNTFAGMAQSLVAAYGLKVIAAIVIFFIGKWLSRLLSRAVGRAMSRTGTDEMLVKFVANLSYAGLLAFVALAALRAPSSTTRARISDGWIWSLAAATATTSRRPRRC